VSRLRNLRIICENVPHRSLVTVRSERISAAVVKLAVLAAAAVVLRLVWLALLGQHEITWEGTEYMRAAENVAHGAGYVGIRGTTLFIFPPLYSLLIAPVVLLSGHGESAGIAVSLIAGSLFVVPIYLTGDLLYGRRAAFFSGVFAVTLPFAVDVSTIVLTDTLFLTLIAWALFFALRTIRTAGPRTAIAWGIVLGLAYCTRPEALVIAAALLVGAVIAMFLRRTPAQRILMTAAVTVAALAVTALPYIAFLSLHAHHLQIEAKTTINLHLAERLQSGMSYDRAASEIDVAGRPIGPELLSNYGFPDTGEGPPAFGTILSIAVINFARHLIDVPNALRTGLFGSPIVLLFALAGLILGPWNRRRAGDELVLCCYVAAVFASLASVYHFYPRYADELLPVLVLWAGHGAWWLFRAINVRLRRRPGRGLSADAAAGTLALVMLLLLFQERPVFKGIINASQTLTEREVGQWMLAEGYGIGLPIFSADAQSVYYAGGTWVPAPWSPDVAATFAYLERTKPKYIVLDAENAQSYPYMQEWLAHGIPDPRARLVRVFSGPGGPVAAVYHWD
jgi:4-amino-4-deoxy-L-arabinose transferase-like glycosyltransferase